MKLPRALHNFPGGGVLRNPRNLCSMLLFAPAADAAAFLLSWVSKGFQLPRVYICFSAYFFEETMGSPA